MSAPVAPVIATPPDGAPVPVVPAAVVAAATPAPTPPAAPVAPVAYTLKLAEHSGLDPALLERSSSLAKELALSNEAAQKVVTAVESEAAAQLEAVRLANEPDGALWKARVAQYASDALSAPDLGNGNSEQLEKIALRAKLVAEKIGGKDIMDFLGATGMGSHPAFLRLFGVKIHNAFGEQHFVQPNAAPAAGRDPALILFGAKSGPAPKE